MTYLNLNQGCTHNWICKITGFIRYYLLLALLILFSSCSKTDDGIGNPELFVSPTEISFSKNGGSEPVEIQTTHAWEIESNESWVTLSRLHGSGAAKLYIGVPANPMDMNRNATVTVISEGNVRQIRIDQMAGDTVVTGGGNEKPDSIAPDNTDMRELNSYELTSEMLTGWNIGNSLDAIGGETAWGNPIVTQELIDSVHAAGFRAIRIPVAWSVFSDSESFTIRSAWLKRVEEVVQYVLNRDMYAIVNLHWDGGWIQPTYEEQEYVNDRLAKMWKQIAVHFRDYNDYLLFAGTNEILVEGEYGTPTSENVEVQNGYNQVFVNTVRSTGGRNYYRHLVVQGYNTNIEHTFSFFIMPQDVIPDRLSVEVHYYDPYNFTLNENSDITQWGVIATDEQKVEEWANEHHVDDQFSRLKSTFVDKNIGVILGEYGVISREEEDGHEVFRSYYLDYMTEAAYENNLIPFYWDNGYTGNHSMGLFDRSSGDQVYPDLIEVIINDN